MRNLAFHQTIHVEIVCNALRAATKCWYAKHDTHIVGVLGEVRANDPRIKAVIENASGHVFDAILCQISLFGGTSEGDALIIQVYTIVSGSFAVVLVGFTCPAMTVATVTLRALVRVRERALGCFARAQIPARQAQRDVPDLPPGSLDRFVYGLVSFPAPN